MIVPLDSIKNKFVFVVVAARRARQLMAGAKLLAPTTAHKTTRMAMQEVLADAIEYEMPDLEPKDEGASKKPKKKK